MRRNRELQRSGTSSVRRRLKQPGGNAVSGLDAQVNPSDPALRVANPLVQMRPIIFIQVGLEGAPIARQQHAVNARHTESAFKDNRAGCVGRRGWINHHVDSAQIVQLFEPEEARDIGRRRHNKKRGAVRIKYRRILAGLPVGQTARFLEGEAGVGVAPIHAERPVSGYVDAQRWQILCRSGDYDPEQRREAVQDDPGNPIKVESAHRGALFL